MSTLSVIAKWCDGEQHPRDPICNEDLPLAERLALETHSHAVAFCRRDRVAIIAALQAIDGLTTEIAELRQEISTLRKEILPA